MTVTVAKSTNSHIKGYGTQVPVTEHFQCFGFELDLAVLQKAAECLFHTVRVSCYHFLTCMCSSSIPSLSQVLNYPQSNVHEAIRLSIHLGE